MLSGPRGGQTRPSHRVSAPVRCLWEQQVLCPVGPAEGTKHSAQLSSFQSLSGVQLFETPWTAARQASLSITNSRSLLRLMSIASVMPSNHLILCHPLLLLPSIFLSIRVFSVSQLFTSVGQSIGVSASALLQEGEIPARAREWTLV